MPAVKRKTRKDGRYEVTARVNGKKMHFYGATKREAQEKRDDYIATVKRCPLLPKEIRLGEWCTAWLESIKPNVTESTVRSYGDVISRLIQRAPIGSVLLQDLTPTMFRTYWQKLLDDGYSSRSVIYCHTVVSAALKQAVMDGALLTNPLLAVRRPKLNKKRNQSDDQRTGPAVFTGSYRPTLSQYFYYHCLYGYAPRRSSGTQLE